MIRTLLFLAFWGSLLTAANAQSNTGWRDSLLVKTRLLRDLVTEQNYEDAQVEAGALRTFLRKNAIYFPPATLQLISMVYWHNKDRNSASEMLSEAEQDAQRDKNAETRAALLGAIVKEHDRWGNNARSEAVRVLHQAAQDTLQAKKVALKTKHYETKVDSLQKALNSAQEVRANTVTLDKYKALALAGAAAFVILGLIVAQISLNNRWQRKWDNRETEWDLNKASHDLPPPPQAPVQPNTETAVAKSSVGSVSAYETPFRDHYSIYEKEPQMALVIESNRQIALYVRSLLSSHFEVTTVDTPAEAIKMANETIPDLIVCDAHLNGQEGIDLVRQIKLSERTNHVPVVLLSKHFGNDGRLDALRAGADAWFTRPMHSEEFNVTVKHLIDGQKARHEEFARLLQLYYSDARPVITNRFLSDTITHIEKELANIDLMPDEIARKMQMSNPLFVRKLRALTGKEPAQLIRELRLEKAKFLLEKRAGTPQAISAMVGFANPGSFSMAFKDYFGENTMLLT